jgi:glycosyltransferase involved in cell wall biosynthesis
MFVITTLEVGGAETLLVDLMRGLDRARFAPELCCLKDLGALGEQMAREIPVASNLLRCKWDLRVLPRLVRRMRHRQIDAVVTVGAGDKMFWGRLAARAAQVPVVISALHSTGWPDGIGRLNRWLTPWTDMYIGVAASHGRYLVEHEGFPPDRVCVVPNGVDVRRFCPRPVDPRRKAQLGLPAEAPLAGIVAALRPEKNHEMFLRVAARVVRQRPDSQFLVIGDGPRRSRLETMAAELGLGCNVRFLGTRSDVAALLPMLDAVLLTSHVEANPVSILESLACGTPVVATRVGSVNETVIDGQTGFLVQSDDADHMARRVLELFAQPELRRHLGSQGRALVERHWSLERMISGYAELIDRLYRHKCGGRPLTPGDPEPAAVAGAAVGR